jgi:hypothetical protein
MVKKTACIKGLKEMVLVDNPICASNIKLRNAKKIVAKFSSNRHGICCSMQKGFQAGRICLSIKSRAHNLKETDSVIAKMDYDSCSKYLKETDYEMISKA